MACAVNVVYLLYIDYFQRSYKGLWILSCCLEICVCH